MTQGITIEMPRKMDDNIGLPDEFKAKKKKRYAIAYIALGSNLGDRLENIKKAIKEVAKQCRLLAKSSIYETEPKYIENQPIFLNAVIRIETILEPLDLLNFLLSIETKLGLDRKKKIKFGPRIIDLDILLYEDLEIETDRLTIPHPRMLERAFVIIPLYEICKEKWVKEALDMLPQKDKEEVRKFIIS